MSNPNSRLVILPCNASTGARCALCGAPGRITSPFDVFTTGGSWACGDCAAHEWGGDTVEALHRIGGDAVVGAKNEGQPEGRTVQQAWRLSCTEYAFGKVPVQSLNLVSVEIRDGLNSHLASVIANELLRRYRDDSADVPF